MMHKKYPGFSFHVVIGKWGRPAFQPGYFITRVCLGFVSFTFMTIDFEMMLKDIVGLKWKDGHVTKSPFNGRNDQGK